MLVITSAVTADTLYNVTIHQQSVTYTLLFIFMNQMYIHI
jgi:hypothetical protein